MSRENGIQITHDLFMKGSYVGLWLAHGRERLNSHTSVPDIRKYLHKTFIWLSAFRGQDDFFVLRIWCYYMYAVTSCLASNSLSLTVIGWCSRQVWDVSCKTVVSRSAGPHYRPPPPPLPAFATAVDFMVPFSSVAGYLRVGSLA
jgi:hypothetical protein